MTQVLPERVPQFDLADRMRKALRETGIDVQDMAAYLGVSRTSVSSWINGRIKPSLQTQRLWALRCGVPFEWLHEGVTDVPRSGPDGDGVWAPRGSNPQPADYKFDGCDRRVTHSSDRVVPFPRRLWPVPEARTAAAA